MTSGAGRLAVAVALLVSGCASDGDPPTPPVVQVARLAISPPVAAPGGKIEVRLQRPPTTGAISGLATELDARKGDGWRPIYTLFSGPGPAFSKDLHPSVDAIGVSDPVTLTLPALRPGRYRLVRSYSPVSSPSEPIRAIGTFRVR